MRILHLFHLNGHSWYGVISHFDTLNPTSQGRKKCRRCRTDQHLIQPNNQKLVEEIDADDAQKRRTRRRRIREGIYDVTLIAI